MICEKQCIGYGLSNCIDEELSNFIKVHPGIRADWYVVMPDKHIILDTLDEQTKLHDVRQIDTKNRRLTDIVDDFVKGLYSSFDTLKWLKKEEEKTMFKKFKKPDLIYPIEPMKFKVVPRELWNLDRINQLMKVYNHDERMRCDIDDDYDILLELKVLLEDELEFVNEKIDMLTSCRKEK